MDATTAQPTLLSAARNFIRKSAGTAVLVITPLAAISVANEAKGQVVFDPPSNFSGGFAVPNTHDSGGFGFFSSQLPQYGDIVGFKEGVSNLFVFNSGSGSYSGDGYVTFPSNFFSGGAFTISGGTVIPVGYEFTLAGTGSVTLASWSLYLSVGGDNQPVASGTGFTTFTGTSLDYVLGSNTNFGNVYVELAFSYINANGDGIPDTISLSMNSGGPGFSVNATPVPEPSTYAGLFGLGALGLAVMRRWRRTFAG